MSRAVTVAAVDLGASNGRVMVGRAGAGELDLVEAHRFPNTPVKVHGTLHWDVLALYRGVLDGLSEAGRIAGTSAGSLDSIGVDSWAVDYGLIDGNGALVGNPVHYRDDRTDGVMATVADRLGPDRIYATTGIQQLPFNTLYQLVAAAGTPQLAAAERLLLIPDLIVYWLTGEVGAEVTNASTTQLYDVRRHAWANELMTAAGIRPDLFPPLRRPGTPVGPLLAGVRAEVGLTPATQVVSVGSHDTASAVVGVPARDPNFAYISCGTWSLVGVELDEPVLTAESRSANFTNEAGVDGTIRYLRNVMGLWLLQESLRTWSAAGQDADLPALLREASTAPAFVSVVDPDDPVFLPPGDMPARIAAYCRHTGQPVPSDRVAIVRCILDSLALAYRRAVHQAQALSGRHADVVHIVGGGARNELLCQLTADACGLPVLAGPVEATALGNVLIQARAAGAVGGDLADLRALLTASQRPVRYEPHHDDRPWAAAAARLRPHSEAIS